MGGHYTINTRFDGTTLSASIYNADHQKHIDNLIPTIIENYSLNTTQMALTTDPGEVGSESLANTLSGELERLRFVLKEMKDNLLGGASPSWYSTVVATFAKSAAQTGYTKLANGIVIQWGFISAVTTTGSTVGATQQINFSYAIPFPTASLIIVGHGAATGAGSSGNEDIEHTVAFGMSSSSGGFCRIMRLFGANAGSEVFGAFYIAIGF